MEPDAHGLTMLPFLAGERSLRVGGRRAGGHRRPVRWRPSPVDIVRAALETVAYRFSMIHERLREACPGLREIVGTGGALLASPAWSGIMADALGTGDHAVGGGRGIEPGARSCSPARRSGSFPSSKRRRRACGRRFQPIPARHARYRVALARHRSLYDVLVPHTTAARRPGP